MIWDCRKKDIMAIKRVGGDVEIAFFTIGSETSIFKEWFEMKKPYKKNYEKIVKLFNELQTLLERQE
jgi:hypothetical protein